MRNKNKGKTQEPAWWLSTAIWLQQKTITMLNMSDAATIPVKAATANEKKNNNQPVQGTTKEKTAINLCGSTIQQVQQHTVAMLKNPMTARVGEIYMLSLS